MKKLFCMLLFAAVCSGSSCENSAIDQCLRREIYKECVDSAPKDKEAWTYIMGKCQQLAEYQSVRKIAQIKPECQP